MKRAPWQRSWSWFKTFIICSPFCGKMRPFYFSIQRMVWVPFFFLFFYYAMQLHYQLDFGYLCTSDLWNETECKRSNIDISPNTTINPNSTKAMPLGVFLHNRTPEDLTKCCRKWTKLRYKEWGARAGKLSSLLTFLLGFYVARIVASWWSQVCGNPDIDNSVLMFAGLASSKNPKFRLPLRKDDTNENTETSLDSSTDFPRAVLEAEKMIARYGLLSWTLCFNTMSPIFRKKFNTFEELKKKGLLNDREERELKVG